VNVGRPGDSTKIADLSLRKAAWGSLSRTGLQPSVIRGARALPSRPRAPLRGAGAEPSQALEASGVRAGLGAPIRPLLQHRGADRGALRRLSCTVPIQGLPTHETEPCMPDLPLECPKESGRPTVMQRPVGR
jgi:hypothetical protein